MNVVVSVATPPDRAALPSGVVPSRKNTLPVGAGVAEAEETVAVSVTDWNVLLGFGLAVRLTLVAASVGLPLGWKLASPGYEAEKFPLVAVLLESRAAVEVTLSVTLGIKFPVPIEVEPL
jgi:hypothetical protein